MPAIPSSELTFITIFDKNSTPKKLLIQDTTDWIATGINQGANPDAFVFLRVTYNSSTASTVIYDNFNNATGNGPDLSRSLASLSTSTIPLPLQTDGNIGFGTYIIEAQYQYLDEFGSDFATVSTSEYDYSWVPPCISIVQRINLSGSNITTTDTTNYGSYLSIVRSHSISPPTNAQLPPLSMAVQTVTNAINVYQDIATGTWGAKIVSVVTYLLTDTQSPQITGLKVIEQLIGCIEFEVVSDVDINALFCCLGNLKAQYEKYLLSNTTKAQIMYDQQIAPLELNLTFYLIFMAGGCLDKAALALEKIKEISGCEDCGCGGDECPTPIPVISGNTNFYDVDSPDASILVTSEVVGDTTIFHISVNPAIIPAVMTYAAEGTDPITVVTTNPTATSTLFTISTSRPIPYVENSAVVKVTMDYDVALGWIISMQKIFTDTSLGIVDDFANHTIAWALGNSGSSFAAFVYANFFTSDQLFVANAQVNNSYYNETNITILPFLSDLDIFEAQVMWIEDNSGLGNKMLVRMYNPIAGKIVTLDELKRTGRTRFQIMAKVQALTS